MYGYVLGTVCVFARNIHGELHYVRAISLKTTSETTGERNETTLAAIDEENSVNGAKRSWKSSIFPLRTGRAERIRQKTERQADNGTETGLKSVQSPLAAFLPIPNYEWNRSCEGGTTVTGISANLRALLMSRRHCFCFPDSRQSRVCPARHERFSPRRCCSRRLLTPPRGKFPCIFFALFSVTHGTTGRHGARGEGRLHTAGQRETSETIGHCPVTYDTSHSQQEPRENFHALVTFHNKVRQFPCGHASLPYRRKTTSYSLATARVFFSLSVAL